MTSKVFLRTELVRKRMKALGLTQLALATDSGVELRTAQRWFAGQPVRFRDAELVARSLGVGTAEAFDGVPEQGANYNIRLLSLVSRLITSRDESAAELARLLTSRLRIVAEAVELRSHPLHGFVQSVRVLEHMRNGYLRIRVWPGKSSANLRVLVRIARGAMVERARITLTDDSAWLEETGWVRSCLGARRNDGSFDLWQWVEHALDAPIVVADREPRIELLDEAEGLEALFDMGRTDAEHAVCVRPAAPQLRNSGFPSCYDRVIHRDSTRLDVPPRHKL